MTRALLSTILVLCTCAHAWGQDWPQFRGADGHATASSPGLPVEFGVDDAAWRVELPGPGDSSPVVHDERVFVTSAPSSDGSSGSAVRVVQCLNARDGSEVWTVEVPFETYDTHQLNSFATSCPVVDDAGIYLSWPDGQKRVVLALDHEGDELWRVELGSYRANHGGGSSPVLVDGTLIVANDNEGRASFLVGLDPATGAERWRRARESGKTSFATPAAYRDDEGTQVIFASTAHGLTSLEPKTGKLLWEVDGLFSERCVATPVIAGDVVFATAGSGGGGKESAAVHIPQHGEQARLQYRARRALPYVPSPVAHAGHIFTFNDGGIVSCLDAGTGRALWNERVDGEFFGSPILVDGRLYAISRAGVLFVLTAGTEFELLAEIDLGEASNATPAVAGGVLYLRTDRHLIAVGPDA